MYFIPLLVLIAQSFTTIQATSTSSPIPYGSTLNFVVNLNNIQEARATNSNLITRPASTSDSPLLDKLSSVWIDPTTHQNLVKRWGNNTGSFVSEYKWPLLAGTLAAGYGYLCYTIISGNNYFAQKELWSSWRNDLSLEQLLAIPQTQFAKELLQEIQRRYTDPAALTDIVRPLGTFMKLIEEEEQQLLSYQTAFSRISYLKITTLIPISTAQFEKIPQRLQRIAYFKNVFQAWAAQYQLEQVSALRFSKNSDYPDVQEMASLMAYHYKISLLNYLAQKQLRITPAE